MTTSPGIYSGIPLESDPAIFTALASAIGVKNLEFQDLLSLDPVEVRAMLPNAVHALILIYSTTPEYEAGVRKARQDSRDAGHGYAGTGADEPVIWFEQTIRHACGFVAILHAASNLSPESEFIGWSLPVMSTCSQCDTQNPAHCLLPS